MDIDVECHFDKLKNTLCSSLVLHFPNMHQPFEIEIDASEFAIGVVLKQGGHPILYYSQTLSEANLMYNTYDMEFYRLV